MSAVWEIRIFGRGRDGLPTRRTYTFVVANEGGSAYSTASAEAKRLAALDGLTDPRVYAATRLREVPSSGEDR